MEAVLKEMIEKVGGKKEITIAALKAKSKSKAGARAISDALHARNIYFRKLRSKPVLTKDDIADRFKFAKAYRRKTKKWWLKNLRMIIDLKHFPVYTTGKARAYAARREIRGAYRTPGQGLDEAYVTVPKALRFNTGVKPVTVAAGVGAGKVLLWEALDGRWNGEAAANLYAGPIKKALAKKYPAKKKYTILEDNDPSGFKSGKGKAAKELAKITVFSIPKHSPDLNVCEYALWKEVNRRMRECEANWPQGKKETRDQYVARLRKTAKALPKKFIEDSIGDMQRRCARLYEVKGSFFEEGGKSA